MESVKEPVSEPSRHGLAAQTPALVNEILKEKGGNRHFGMKAHIGADAESDLWMR